VKTIVLCQLRMKSGCQQVPLLGGNNATIIKFRQGLRPAVDRFDERRTDEDGVKLRPTGVYLFQDGHIQVYFEAGDLSTEGVSLCDDVHQMQQGLVSVRIIGKKDCTCAGAPDCLVVSKLPQRLNELIVDCQLSNRG